MRVDRTVSARLAAIAITAVSILGTSLPAAGQAPYRNPVIGNPEKVERGVADPFVLKWNGEYYLYFTGHPIEAYHSTDLVNWEPVGPVLTIPKNPDGWNQADVWAPEVVYRNGRFYLYYTATRQYRGDWRIGEMARRIGVAVSDSPRGPFVDSGQPLTPGWGIDGHVFLDPDSGEEYFFYSYFYEPRYPGAGLVVDRLLSWNKLAGRPSHVIRGSEAWEDKDGDPNNGSLRYTDEAPTVRKRDGKYYMTYSGGSWDLPTYSLGYATAPEVSRGGLDGPGWNKVVPPILRSTPVVEGPGHNGLVKAPNNVDDINFYHGRVVPFRSPGDRLTFMDRLDWNHDRMFTLQPSLGPLTPPDKPVFADLFNRADGPLGSAWETANGEWRVAGGQARQNSSVGTAQALPRTGVLTHYLFEANLRFAGGDAGEGAAGVVAYASGDANRVDLSLDRGRRVLAVSGALAGETVEERTVALPAEFRFDAYHQILVTKNAGRLTFQIDGINRPALDVDGVSGAGRPGLQTRSAQAEFDGVALSPWFEDRFNRPEVNWTIDGGTWLADEGALHQVQGGAMRAVALKGDPAEDYEFSASLRWLNQESVESTAGVVAASAGNARVLVGYGKTIWPFTRLNVRHFVGDEVKDSLQVQMPRGFAYAEFHTLRVVKQGHDFRFFLDGVEAAAARFPLGEARPGVYTEGVRAAFDDCAMKRLVVRQNLALNGSFETEPWNDGARVGETPWGMSGQARVIQCCGHTGRRHVSIRDGAGEARQRIDGLQPGEYVLEAWASAAGGAKAELCVGAGDADPASVAVESPEWGRYSVPFSVPEGQGSASIWFRSQETAGSARADDFYVYRR